MLPFRPYYAVGRVVKHSICNSSNFWRERCNKIFEKKWPPLKEDSLPPIGEKQVVEVMVLVL